MRFERRQIHLDIKHSFDELGDLRPSKIGKARDQQSGNVLPQKARVGRALRMLGRVE